MAQPKLVEGTCERKWISRMAEGVGRFWRMLLVSRVRSHSIITGSGSGDLKVDVSDKTYTLFPSTRTNIKLPLRCWGLLASLLTADSEDPSSVGFSRL